jgi:hypothetical protein
MTSPRSRTKVNTASVVAAIANLKSNSDVVYNVLDSLRSWGIMVTGKEHREQEEQHARPCGDLYQTIYARLSPPNWR